MRQLKPETHRLVVMQKSSKMEVKEGYKPLIFLGLKAQRRLRLNINENKLSATDHVKLLGIEVDNKLKFSNHVETLCPKVNKKLGAFF